MQCEDNTKMQFFEIEVQKLDLPFNFFERIASKLN